MMRAADLTEIDRREVTLWRLVGRWDEACREGNADAMGTLMAGFRKRLGDYERATTSQAVLL